MIASRRIFIVSSSHQYHNCKIPFLYEHVMTPFMSPRRRRYLFLLSILSRASTSHIVFAPIMFAPIRIPYQSRSSRLCHHRSSAIAFTREPFDKPKVLYHQVTFRNPYIVGTFDCTLYIMYYQNCRFCLICTNTSYVTLDFHTIPTPGPLSYSS